MVNPPGETISHTAVNEYQRRGLPHIHFLGEHAHDLHFHDHVPPDVHVPAQAVVAADREGADGVNVTGTSTGGPPRVSCVLPGSPTTNSAVNSSTETSSMTPGSLHPHDSCRAPSSTS